MPIRYLKRHDTAVAARALLKEEDGTPLSFVGADEVVYTMVNKVTNEVKIDRATADFGVEGTGEVFYFYDVADVEAAGLFSEEWEVLFNDGTKLTFPVKGEAFVKIAPDLDNT